MEGRKLRLHPSTKSSPSQLVDHRHRHQLRGCKRCLDLRAELFRFPRPPQAGLPPTRPRYIAYSYTENSWDNQSCKIVKLVHRVISRRHTAVGQLADFQGANDEHISIDT